MRYSVVFKPSAERGFRDLPPQIQPRLAHELASLSTVPRPPGCAKLKGRPGFRIRVGDWRVIYAVDDDARLVRILAVGNRRDVYR